MVRFLKSLRPFTFWSSSIILAACFGYISTTLAQKEQTKKSYTAPAAAKGVKTEASPILIKTSKESISLADFENAYHRMNDKEAYVTSLDSLKDFLSIYSDYRLKLIEAKELKIDQDPKIQKEIEGYRALLAGPFIIDKEVTEPQVRKVYERRKWDVDVAHFLAQVKGKGNNPADTMVAYKRALKAIEKLNNGETMSEIVLSDKDLVFLTNTKKAIEQQREENTKKTVDSNAWEGSDDKTSAKNNGDLGYFTGGQTVRNFEDVVYSLKIGEYTKTPVRTRYGYHVIMLLDKYPHLGGVKVHHILINMNKTVSGKDTLPFYHRADSLLQAIKAGAKFEEVARESSDDKFTSSKNGDLDYIDREMRRAEPAFDRAAYSMKDGEISGIVRTSKGYHIIRRDGTLQAKTYDQEKDGIKKLYKQFYFNDDRTEKLNEVKKQNGANIVQSALNIFMSRVDSTRTSLDSTWAKKITSGERNLTLYEMSGKKWNISTIIDSLNAQPGTPLARNSVIDQINKNLDEEAISIMARDISIKYPEFENIMADYKNGITLFELENKRIWQNVVPDSVKERQYYEDNKDRFMWPERIDVSEIYLYNDSIAKDLYKRIINGENFDTLAKKYTERPGFKEKAGHWGLMTKDENEMSKKAFSFTVDDIKEPFPFQSGFSIVKLNRRVPVTLKSFEDARQEVASQYQDDLSKELRLKWVTELRKKYNLHINYKVIEDAWKAHQLSSK